MDTESRQDQELFLLTKRVIELENRANLPHSLEDRIKALEDARKIQIELNKHIDIPTDKQPDEQKKPDFFWSKFFF